MKFSILLLLFLMVRSMQGQTPEESPVREKLLMDFGWRFALGHACDTKKEKPNMIILCLIIILLP